MKFSIQLSDINGAPVGEPIVLKCPAEAAGFLPRTLATTVDKQKLPVAGSLNGGTCKVAFYLDIEECPAA